MFCKQRTDKSTWFLFVVSVYFHTFRVGHSVSLGQRGEGSTAYRATRWERVNPDDGAQQGDAYLGAQVVQGPGPRRSNQPGLTAEPVPYYSATTPDDSSSWTVGDIRTEPRSSASESEDGYQADFTGLHGVQGKVSGPPFDSLPHFTKWLAMRPVVQCDHSVMTFTASGEEIRHLFVHREGASPISLFQLPSYCRYSVRTSWRDLEMMVPYDACYMIQENGSYVLPMLWWGSPLKLSCPVQMSTPVPPVSNSALSVLCSSYGMALQINGQEPDIRLLGVIVNGHWGPFVSEECGYRVPSHPGELTFFTSYSAPCITSGNGLRLQLMLNDQEYVLSCPANPQFPNVPSPPHPSPVDNQFPYIPDLVYPFSPYQPPAWAHATSSPNINPVQESSTHQFSKIPVGSSEYASGGSYPYEPFYYPAVTPALTSEAKETTTSTVPPQSPNYPQYSLQMPCYPAAPQAPSPFAPSSPSPPTPSQNQPVGPQYPHYPPHIHLPPAKETEAPQANCPHSTHTMCSHYPNPHYPHYHPLYLPPCHPPYQPLPQYPETPPPTTTTPPTTSTTAQPTPQIPQLQCMIGRMVVFLPFAHPDSIQVRDQMMTWLLVSSVSPVCGYMMQTAEGSGVILHSPLPACHSQSQTPTTVSLPLRFWDVSVAQYRSLDPQCPYQTPTPVTPTVSPTPPSTTKGKGGHTVVPTPKVFCSSHQMTVELPSGPFSGIVIKDIKGNQMTLQDAPKDCGYSAGKGKDGKTRLSIQLHSRCHVSVQGKMYIITVVYMTVNGIREAQFSCPVLVPGPGQECNLPSEQRLPCGPSSVSQPQCLSMGCCFDNHPLPATTPWMSALLTATLSSPCRPPSRTPLFPPACLSLPATPPANRRE
ncbi:uncharacterized protein LOC129096134 [Anoplopoma fimbria]|uniref:uncharacterized protein LOC129096134 n=1 Tax=Anoplopoma fimbria TaxID=229290 RepID=UPI0023EC9ED7|nr:uncharacterized protein LOC129096134 [Anoplopoma fimbria]